MSACDYATLRQLFIRALPVTAFHTEALSEAGVIGYAYLSVVINHTTSGPVMIIISHNL